MEKTAEETEIRFSDKYYNVRYQYGKEEWK